MVRKIVLSIVAVLAVSFAALAQNKQVSGTVTNSDGLAVAGATVIVEGTTNGVITDTNGAFNLSAPANGTLVVSFLGYEEAMVPVAGKTSINVVLKTASEKLDEVTVVAFGTKRKQDIVGSVATVKEGLISNSQATSVSAALEGAVAGLQVFTSSGQPGSDSSILLRGVGSLDGSNGALIVVDGVPFNGSLSDLNPADIQSITVSKDAVSNSLYGSRAAGGVVMVTTKRGSNDRIQINFTGNWGVTSRAYKDYDMVTDPGEFYELTWYGIRNSEWARNEHDLAAANAYATENLLGAVGNYNAFIIDACPKCGEVGPLVGLDGKLNPNARLRYNDSFADALFDTSFRQEYQVSAAGGSDKSDYYVSLSYLDNDSYVIGSDFTRLTTRVNLNTQLRKWLRVGANLSYSKTDQNGVQESTSAASNPFDVARSWAPIYPVHAYDAEGNLKYNVDGTPMYDAGTGQTDGTISRPTATNQNVVCSMLEDVRNAESHNLATRLFAEIKFLKDFTFTANYAYDYSHSFQTVYYTPTIGDGQSFQGRSTKYSGSGTTTNFNQILAYNKIVGEHNISAKIGHEYYVYKGRGFEGQKTRFFDPMNHELINGGQMEYITSSTSHHNIEGYFAMADYNYGSKYYLSAAYRRDGTSRFLQRWGNFWSVGAGWRISKEKWMENAEWVNDLKIRASYGTQGNENGNLGYTPYQDLWSVTWDGSQLAYSPAFYGNPDLTWEKQATVDAGIDFRLWNRVSGSIEYYYRKTDDMLFQVPKSIASGRPYNWENLGAMSNQGVEFEVTVDLVKTRKVNWSVTLVGAHNTNKLLTLPEENRKDGIVAGQFKRMEGKSIYEYYTYRYAGMNEIGQPQWHGFQRYEEDGENYKKGDYVLDEAGNKIPAISTNYSYAEKEYIGKTATPDLTGGLSTTFKWNGIDINIATAFQIGGWAYDSSYVGELSHSFYIGHHRDLWKTFNPETMSGEYPIWNANDSVNTYTKASDAHLISASYFSLRNVTIGYSFPKKWMQKLGMGGIRIYVTGDNLALWSKRQGFDPRVSVSGGNSGFSGYAPLRVISGGINLTF